MIETYSSLPGGVKPEDVGHRLDDVQAVMWIGNFHLAVPCNYSDDQLKVSVLTAQRIVEEAGFMLRDLEYMVGQRAEQREAERTAARQQHAEQITAAEPGDVLVAVGDVPLSVHATDLTVNTLIASPVLDKGQTVRIVGIGSNPDGDERFLFFEDVNFRGQTMKAHVLGDVPVTYLALAAPMADPAEVPCPSREQGVEHTDHIWEWSGATVWCPGFVPEPDVLASPCERWSLEVEHDAHFFGEGLRCPGWSVPAGGEA